MTRSRPMALSEMKSRPLQGIGMRWHSGLCREVPRDVPDENVWLALEPGTPHGVVPARVIGQVYPATVALRHCRLKTPSP